MQDRKAARSIKPLATHGRTIHWVRRIKGSYITQEMLANVEPPTPPLGPTTAKAAFGILIPGFGNEWLLNLQVLGECGVP
jgi:hypothetical protein